MQCWGENFYGQLGLMDGVARGSNVTDMGDNLPVVPLGNFDVSSVYSGDEFNCAVAFDGTMKV